MDKQIILREIPQEVIDEYEVIIHTSLDKVIADINKLDTLFKRAVQDFNSGKISADDLSQIGYIVMNNLEDINSYNTNLGTAAVAASELSYYARQSDGDGYERMLKSVLDYTSKAS